MKIYLATDHTGLELKNTIKNFLEKEGYDVEDCGAYEYDRDDDYPDFIGKAAEGVSKDQTSLGIIMGGSGQGEQMVANKYKGVRCALFYTPAAPAQAVDISGKTSTDAFEIVKLTRQHNHANMLSLGVRFLTQEDAIQAVKIFLNTAASQEERHARRVNKIKHIENNA
ncbi:MAG: RpiB/LacA/LacB family sugar-phosphate isomerase [Candidatus Levybacteria bacterium]|nr:RpiB/LacA/LacB family sugar-phosphate isomerase [Candidatus Levybacteria bacterium]